MKKILVVDDEKDQLFVIEQAFKELYSDEYEVISAKSGKECLKILQKQTPDVIVLDLMMPQMNGWEVFDKLKENPKWRSIPVIILTARTDGFAERAGELIAEDYIKKPIDMEEFKSRIDMVLEKKK